MPTQSGPLSGQPAKPATAVDSITDAVSFDGLTDQEDGQTGVPPDTTVESRNRVCTSLSQTLLSLFVLAVFSLSFLGSVWGISPEKENAGHWNVPAVGGKKESARSQFERREALLSGQVTYTAQSSEPSLLFAGNTTVIVPPGGLSGLDEGLRRESDCSITAYFTSETASSSQTAGTLALPTVANYQNFLHTTAGLKTTGGTYPSGCKDQELGIPSRYGVYLGLTKGGGSAIGANIDFNNNLWAGSMSLSAGTYSDIELITTSAFSVLAADIEGNGYPDLLVLTLTPVSGTYPIYRILVYHNNGDGTFTEGISLQLSAGTGGVTADDFNGDGKVDLAFITDSKANVLPGNGDGTFGTAITTTLSSQATGAAAGDFNGDGKKDLVLATGAVLLGDGTGHFTAASTSITFAGVEGGNPVVGDWNKDGDEDVAMMTGGEPGILTIYLGKGDGSFSQGASYQIANNLGTVSAADLDGDGNLDLIAGEGNGGIYGPDYNSSGVFQALMGRGDGTFAGAPSFQDYVSKNFITDGGFTTGDFHGKGDVDLVTSSPAGIQMLTNDGTGTFTPSLAIPGILNSSGLAVDIDGDGKTDLLIAESTNDGWELAIARGNGDGTFQPTTSIATPGGVLAVGDFTGDGKPDVVLVSGNELWLMINEGKGQLGTATLIATEANPILNAVAADLNGDKKLDLVLVESTAIGGTTAGAAVVFLGNGDGTFKSGVNYTAGYAPLAVAVGDMNKDGILDLVVASTTDSYGSGSLYTLAGKGDGTFGAPKATALNYAGVTGVSVADFNGDGNSDVAVTTCCGASYSSVAFGNGTGAFPTIYDLALGASATAVVAIDVNKDGKPDLLLQTQSYPASLVVLLNQYGSATATLIPTTTKLSASATSVTTGTKITFTATVAPTSGTATPTGTVTFYDGTTSLGTGTLSSGTATLAVTSLAAGTHSITASYGGDNTDAASKSTAVAVTVEAASLTATTSTLGSSATSVPLGTSVTFTDTTTSSKGTPTGTVTFLDGITTLGTGTLSSSGKAIYSTSTLIAGTHSITASYAGDATDARSKSTPVAVTVEATLIATTSTLASSAASIRAGSNVTFTDTLQSASGIPSGSVTFLDGTKTLGTGTLNGSGVATYSTTTLAAGMHSVTAAYSGNSTYSGSTSSVLIESVTVPAPTFSLAINPSAISLSRTASTTATVSVTPVNGFDQQVSFACSGLPANATCSFSPTTVTPSGTTAATTTLTIATGVQTPIASAASRTNIGKEFASGALFLAVLLPMGAMFRFRRVLYRLSSSLLIVGISAGILISLSGCGNGGPSHATPPGVSTITVTATAGSSVQIASLQLTVQ